MRQQTMTYHSSVLATHNLSLFDKLLYPHHITTETVKEYEFEDKEGNELERPLRGYFAVKEVDGKKVKYFIDETHYENLPIRINNTEELYFKDSTRTKSIIMRPTDITRFKITPQQCFTDDHEFINSLCPFEHTHPDHWTLSKIIALQAYVGKTFTGICSPPEFGKSSMYSTLHALTQKSPVFVPRSIPGILINITSDGIMCFDDVHSCTTEVREHIETFSFNVADNKPVYINGAMESKNTKSKYDVTRQSIVFLFNRVQDYRNPEKEFWNHLWKGRAAMESRFLCLKLEGKLLEKFDKDFDIPSLAEKNRPHYIAIAKHLLWLKERKHTNTHKRRYTTKHGNQLTGRHKVIFEELCWMIDVYAKDQTEYDKFTGLLEKAVEDYKTMIGHKNASSFETDNSLTQAVKEDPVTRIMQALGNTDMSLEELETITGIKDIDTIVQKLLEKGDVIQVEAGVVRRTE